MMNAQFEARLLSELFKQCSRARGGPSDITICEQPSLFPELLFEK
jgi:hypothetical protein